MYICQVALGKALCLSYLFLLHNLRLYKTHLLRQKYVDIRRSSKFIWNPDSLFFIKLTLKDDGSFISINYHLAVKPCQAPCWSATKLRICCLRSSKPWKTNMTTSTNLLWMLHKKHSYILQGHRCRNSNWLNLSNIFKIPWFIVSVICTCSILFSVIFGKLFESNEKMLCFITILAKLIFTNEKVKDEKTWKLPYN